jgi:hypothetical protein
LLLLNALQCPHWVANPTSPHYCFLSGGYKFKLSEEGSNVLLEVEVPKFLSTSLVDVDVQPTYASVVIKGKVACALSALGCVLPVTSPSLRPHCVMAVH